MQAFAMVLKSNEVAVAGFLFAMEVHRAWDEEVTQFEFNLVHSS
jgi:hypothetical protein